MRRRGWTAAVLLAALAAAVAVSSWPQGGVTRRATEERLLGPTSGATPVEFSLVLRLGERRLRRFTAGLYDPRSGSYHHFIDARTFGRRFGISERQLARLRGVLRRAGVQVTTEYPQRTSIDVSAPAGTVDRWLGVQMMNYLSPAGRSFHAPVGEPQVPKPLQGAVSGVAGLSGRFAPAGEDVPNGGLSPTTASNAYDFAPLYRQGIQGQGERIALISFARFDQSDLDSFAHQFGLPRFQPVDIPSAQDGPATDTSSDGVGEADLDVEILHAVAPQAEILNYNAPDLNASGADTLGELVDRIVSDGRADIATDSYGFCELTTSRSDIQRDEQAIEAAVAHGISIFKSTGDRGAYECQGFDRNDTRLSVEWPASSPGVVAVGGSTLSVTPTGGYAGEAAWEGTLSEAGGGGGVSAVMPRPGWQRALGVVNRFSTGRRQLPDLSASADPDQGWADYSGGQLEESGGTSAASPFMAASMALIEQYARQHGVARLGFVDPLLYAIASSPQKVPPFHDITVGNNRYYPATTGWDFATGLGSPDVYNLAQDMVDYLNSHGGG